MVVDDTVPSLVLLVLLAATVVVARVGPTVRGHVRRTVLAAAARPAVDAGRWCPRVVLIDDDRHTPATA